MESARGVFVLCLSALLFLAAVVCFVVGGR
jgi:hypothetical protein